MVDHTMVYHPAVMHLKNIVDQNHLGKLLYFQSTRMNLGLYERQHFDRDCFVTGQARTGGN